MFRVIGLGSYRRAWAVPLLLLAGATGCGGPADNLNRQAFSGTVTLDGKPLAEGTIHFVPSSPEATTEVSEEIKGGKYSFSKVNGPVPGPYKVQISAPEPQPFQPPPGKTPGEFVIPVAKQNVPEKYNLKTILTTTIKPDQSGAIDFALSSASQ
jgi:hypothetical protein